ncbi:MAG TPA: YraN family protein [Firmicutes bacterium]|nr:YraN family protein [Bacillota bacterium]
MENRGGAGAKSIGDKGEAAAAAYLEKAGFSILCRNYHSRYGEIDMIAADEKYILFVEVKTRGRGSLGRPAEAVGPAKQKKIMRTAVAYLLKHPTKLQPRFDIVEVFRQGGAAEAEIHHIPNAFWLEDAYGLF